VSVTFSGTIGLKSEVYCDADWSEGEDQKSIEAYITILAGGEISWRSKKQSTEAEYMAMLEATKESILDSEALKRTQADGHEC
jgi:hypothetical protein